MKTKRMILAIAILIGGVLFTVDALNNDVNDQETAHRIKKLGKIPSKG